MRAKYILIICLFLLGIKSLFAQQAALTDQLQRFGAENPQEKVYLHLNQPHYLTGDDIWLKGYVTIGIQNRLSALSKILYVDLIGPDNKLVTSVKLLMLHGTAIGDMHLVDTLQEGTYHLRAYTNWMRNLPQETFFNKAIAIGRPQVDPAVVQSGFTYNASTKQLIADVKLTGQTGTGLQKTLIKYAVSFTDKTSAEGTAATDNDGRVHITFNNDKNFDLKQGVLALTYTIGGISVHRDIAVNVQRPENTTNFMPEGGDMVTGLQSKVAFKMLQPDGFSASGAGYITDDTGASIVDFTSGFAGMGSFFLTPQAGKSYKAIITYANGTKQTVNLPAALPEGYNLTVMQRPSFAYLAVTASPVLVKNQKLTLLVQRQGAVFYYGQSVLSKPESLTKLPLANLPSGLIQVTLFNEQLQPVCERLFFNTNKNTVLPLTAQLNNSYQNRKAVTVNLNAGEAADSLRIGSFSASVVNIAGLPPLKANRSGILPGLLLTPEIKGYTEDPDHYFETTNTDSVSTRATELDNLVLCQGWRRINWDYVKAGKWPGASFAPEKAFTVSGTVSQRNGAPAAKAKVSLLSTKSFVAIDTLTDANGHFVFDNLLLKDSTRLALGARDVQSKTTLRVKTDQLVPLDNVSTDDIRFPDDLNYQSFLKSAYKELPDTIKTRLAGYHILRQVNVVSIKDKKSQVPSYSANLNGPGNADQVFIADEMKSSVNLQQFLQGRAMGLIFDDTKHRPYLSRSLSFKSGDGSGTDSMKVYYDGVLVSLDASFSINDIAVDDVESIEILRTTATSALYGTTGGVMIITGKTGKSTLSISKASPDYLPLLLSGYHTIREFYVPDYSVNQNTLPDHRTTVYWKPDIVTDKQGNASFKFFTTDDKGTYRICVEGMTADGRPAHLVKDIKVE